MTERFFVDERVGCVAVRDRFRTDSSDQGLSFDTRGVVKFWGGEQVTRKCPECGHEKHDGFKVPPEHIAEAHALCDSMNANPTAASMVAAGVAFFRD